MPTSPRYSLISPLVCPHTQQLLRPLQWTDGDVWTVALHLPYGADVQYKYVLLRADGSLLRYCDEESPPGEKNCKVSGCGWVCRCGCESGCWGVCVQGWRRVEDELLVALVCSRLPVAGSGRGLMAVSHPASGTSLLHLPAPEQLNLPACPSHQPLLPAPTGACAAGHLQPAWQQH